MIVYLLRRALGIVIVLLLCAFFSFGLVSLAPGDFYTPLLLTGIDADSLEALRVMRGVDKPWVVQFWIWLEGVITRGDFGVSFSPFNSRPASEILFGEGSGIGWTLIITGSSMILAWLVGIPVAILSALRRRTWADTLIAGITYLGISIPGYILGWCFLWFIYRFVNPLLFGSGTWGLLDLAYQRTPFSFAKLLNYLWHLWPAWIIVGAPMFAMIVRNLRSTLLDTFSAHYLATARAKGLSELRTILKHALPNALNPLVSMFGIMLPTLLAGSIIATQVLGLPTFGRVFLTAMQRQDQHVLTGAFLLYCIFLLIGNVIADVSLAAIDPRIRHE